MCNPDARVRASDTWITAAGASGGGEHSLPTIPLEVFLAAVNGQRNHTEAKLSGTVRNTPTLILFVRVEVTITSNKKKLYMICLVFS